MAQRLALLKPKADAAKHKKDDPDEADKLSKKAKQKARQAEKKGCGKGTASAARSSEDQSRGRMHGGGEKKREGKYGESLPAELYIHRMWMAGDKDRKCLKCMDRSKQGN